MPAKKTRLTDAERAKNMRALAREVGASTDPNILEEAVQTIGRHRDKTPKSLIAQK